MLAASAAHSKAPDDCGGVECLPRHPGIVGEVFCGAASGPVLALRDRPDPPKGHFARLRGHGADKVVRRRAWEGPDEGVDHDLLQERRGPIRRLNDADGLKQRVTFVRSVVVARRGMPETHRGV